MEATTTEQTGAATFDAKRAILSKRDMFRPLAVQRTDAAGRRIEQQDMVREETAAAGSGAGRCGAYSAHQPDDLSPCCAGRVERETLSCYFLSAVAIAASV